MQLPVELATEDLLELTTTELLELELLDDVDELLGVIEELLPPPHAPRSAQVCFDVLFSSPGSKSGQAAGIPHQLGMLHEYSRPLWDTF